jgi:hypothetical protein
MEIESTRCRDELIKSEKQVRSLQNERDKMRIRITRLKNRRAFNIN